jgi:phosphonopyruvate decarboxylase
MFSFREDTKNFYMAGYLGGALSLGLGSALAGNKTVVCGGDAEFVMHMGGLVTSGRYKDLKGHLLYIVFDNQCNKSTGGQRTYQEHINYNQLAKFSGFNIEEGTIEDLIQFKDALSTSENKKMHFIHVKCSLDQITERPPAKDLIKSKEEFS